MPTYVQTPIISRIYTSRNVLLDQLEKREYDTSEYSNFSVNEIHIMKENAQLDMLMNNKDNNKIYVKYHIIKALRPNHIYDYSDDLFQIEEVLTKKDQLIIIIKDVINDTIINTLKQLYNTDGYFITVFTLNDLLYNILNHTLVPSHRILLNNELEQIQKQYNIKELKQLPEISRFDPVSKVIRIRPTQACEIIRKSKTAITSKYYRLCY